MERSIKQLYIYAWLSIINFVAIGYLLKILIDICINVVYFVKRNKMDINNMYKEVLLLKDKIGIGTSSIVLFTIAIIWLDKCDDILLFLGIPSWTNGDMGQHIGSCYSLLFFIPAYIVAFNYRNDLGATLFMKLSGIFSLLYMTASIQFVIY